MPVQISVIGAVAAALLTAAVVAFITTPVVRTLAFRVGAVDVPRDSRRMHNHPIPRMGGLAIFFGFILSALIFVPLDAPLRGMLLGAVVIVILGIFDDIYALPALPKLLVQPEQQFTAYTLANNGMGATIVSDALLRCLAPSDRLVYYKLPDKFSQQSLYFYYKHNRYITPTMHRFLEVAQAQLGCRQSEA